MAAAKLTRRQKILALLGKKKDFVSLQEIYEVLGAKKDAQKVAIRGMVSTGKEFKKHATMRGFYGLVKKGK